MRDVESADLEMDQERVLTGKRCFILSAEDILNELSISREQEKRGQYMDAIEAVERIRTKYFRREFPA